MRVPPIFGFTLVPALIALAACSSSPSTGTGGATTTTTTTTGNGGGATGGAAPIEVCTATFHWLQKDAYKDTAGRTTSLWPPHTTTTLDVRCQLGDDEPVEIANVFNANHGTEPSAKDANGVVILEEIRVDEAKGSRADLLDLVAKFEACECDPATKFLSLDSLKDAAVDALLKNVVAYFQTHLSCASPGGADALIQALQAGDFDQVLTDLPSCTWDSGADLASGLDDALQTFLATTQEVLSGYHVCNNDAELQATLFQSFVDTKKVTACDGTVDLCKGPKWLYDP